MDSIEIQKSFLALYDESADAVFRHSYFRVHDRELAKDLTQEAFARMWEYLAAGKAVDNKKAFLFRILNNLIIDYYRKKKELSLDAMAESGFDPKGDGHESVEAFALGQEALRAVGGLDENFREVITLRYVNDLSIGEIAEITRESENAVSVRLHRAVKKLKDVLEHGPS